MRESPEGLGEDPADRKGELAERTPNNSRFISSVPTRLCRRFKPVKLGPGL